MNPDAWLLILYLAVTPQDFAAVPWPTVFPTKASCESHLRNDATIRQFVSRASAVDWPPIMYRGPSYACTTFLPVPYTETGTNIAPMGDRLLVERLEPLPPLTDTPRPLRGRLLALGHGVPPDTPLRVGDTVFYARWSGQPIEGTDRILMPREDVIALEYEDQYTAPTVEPPSPDAENAGKPCITDACVEGIALRRFCGTDRTGFCAGIPEPGEISP